MRAEDRVDVDALATKLSTMRPLLDERQWRVLLGAEANAIGHGGVRLVARTAGVSATTVSRGAEEARNASTRGVVGSGSRRVNR